MSVPLSTIWAQYFPPRGPLTEDNLPSQTGKVFIVTGGSNGLGYELSRQLYGAGGKVYIMTRSKDRTEVAISNIKAHYEVEKKSRGSLEFIEMDLINFESVRAAAQDFLSREGPNGRLDVLFNNAGAGARKNAPPGTQGHEYHFATNVLGPFLLTQLLSPILHKTAERTSSGAVRVTWPGSLMVDTSSPKEGVRKEFLDDPDAPQKLKMSQNELYASSKAACYFLATEFSRREPKTAGVIHLAGNPGNYATNLWVHLKDAGSWGFVGIIVIYSQRRQVPTLLYALVRPVLRDPFPHGADTWLWMGLSDEVTLEDAAAGRYAMCDGRWHPGQRGDLVSALRRVDEGGSGRATELFHWCEKELAKFLK